LDLSAGLHSDTFAKGSETTAVTLRWVIKFLAANPRVQHKLHGELLRAGIPSTLEDDAPLTTFADLYSDKVPYLDAVSSEVMRVSKVANITTRESKITPFPLISSTILTRIVFLPPALVDTQILGHRIPKGTTIFFTITGTGFSETEKDRARLEALDPVRSKTSSRKFGWWGDDAQSFVPERWIDAEGKFNPKAGPSMPFSTGPRGCYGQKLAVRLQWSYPSDSYL
jgi:cytochrome P450